MALSDEDSQCVGFIGFNTIGEIVRIFCGQWKCKRCAKRNARRWAVRVMQHITAQQDIADQLTSKTGVKHYPHEFRFWTLTLRASIKTAKQGYAVLPRLWDNLRKAITRYYGDPNWQYIAFVEAHPKRGNIPHFHVISSLPVPYLRVPRKDKNGKVYLRLLRLKDLAYKCGFGFQAYDKPITGKKAANYVAKYASKGSDTIPKGFRRVRVSRHWRKLDKWNGYPFIAKAQNETNYHYVMRVHQETSIDIELLWERWTNAIEFDK